MSYGWLSEGTIAPRKPKAINVPKTSINVLSEIIKKRGTTQVSNKRGKVDYFDRQNSGVLQRNKDDLDFVNAKKSKKVRQALVEKERIYNELASGKCTNNEAAKHLLVDFDKQREIATAACTIEKEDKTLEIKSADKESIGIRVGKCVDYVAKETPDVVVDVVDGTVGLIRGDVEQKYENIINAHDRINTESLAHVKAFSDSDSDS